MRARPDVTAAGFEAVGAVFDEDQVAVGGRRAQRFHIAQQAVQVHGDDGPSAAGDARRDGLDRDTAVRGVHVSEDRRGARHQNRVSGRDKGHGGDDDLVAGADSLCEEGQVQGGGARIQAHDVCAAEVVCEGLLGRRGASAGGQDGVVEGGAEASLFLVPEAVPIELDRFLGGHREGPLVGESTAPGRWVKFLRPYRTGGRSR